MLNLLDHLHDRFMHERFNPMDYGEHAEHVREAVTAFVRDAKQLLTGNPPVAHGYEDGITLTLQDGTNVQIVPETEEQSRPADGVAVTTPTDPRRISGRNALHVDNAAVEVTTGKLNHPEAKKA